MGVSLEPQSTTDSTTGRNSMSPCSFTVTRFPHLGSMPLTFELSGGFDICPLGISSHASAPPYRESVQSWGNSHVENSSAKLGGHPPPPPNSAAITSRGCAQPPCLRVSEWWQRPRQKHSAAFGGSRLGARGDVEAQDDRSRRGSLDTGVVPTRCAAPGAGTQRHRANGGREVDG